MKPTNVAVYTCDGEWKIDAQGVCEWSPGSNNAWGAITIDDSKFSITSMVDQMCLTRSINKNEHDLKLSYLPPPNPYYNPRPVYLKTSECLIAYLAFGGVSERPLLHVELIKKIKCENDVYDVHLDIRDPVGENENNIYASPDAYFDGALIVNNVVEASSSAAQINDTPIGTLNEKINSNDEIYESYCYPDGSNFSLHQEFGSKKEFKTALHKIAVEASFEIQVLKTCTSLYSVRCLDQNCGWRIRAAQIKGSDRFSIRTYCNMHTCTRSRKNGQTSAALIADMLVENFKGEKEVPVPKEIMAMMQNKGVEVTYYKAWRAKQLAIDMLKGDS